MQWNFVKYEKRYATQFIAIEKQGKFLKFFCKSLVTLLDHKNNIWKEFSEGWFCWKLEKYAPRDFFSSIWRKKFYPKTIFFNVQDLYWFFICDTSKVRCYGIILWNSLLPKIVRWTTLFVANYKKQRHTFFILI